MIIKKKLDEEIQATRDDLVEKVDNYLNYVVEQWMSENQLQWSKVSALRLLKDS